MVLWDMTIGPCLSWGGVIGVIMIVCGFFLWFFLSMSSDALFPILVLTNAAICILVLMEGTSAMVSYPSPYPTPFLCPLTPARESTTAANG